MTFEVTYRRTSSFLHATVRGQNSIANVKRYLAAVAQECMKTDCRRVLIEERLEGPRLETMKVFDIASEGSSELLGFFKAIAYVDVHSDGELMRFAEDMAVNRSLPVRVFATVEQAEAWLETEPT